jgi:hypothetical protein
LTQFLDTKDKADIMRIVRTVLGARPHPGFSEGKDFGGILLVHTSNELGTLPDGIKLALDDLVKHIKESGIDISTWRPLKAFVSSTIPSGDGSWCKNTNPEAKTWIETSPSDGPVDCAPPYFKRDSVELSVVQMLEKENTAFRTILHIFIHAVFSKNTDVNRRGADPVFIEAKQKLEAFLGQFRTQMNFKESETRLTSDPELDRDACISLSKFVAWLWLVKAGHTKHLPKLTEFVNKNTAIQQSVLEVLGATKATEIVDAKASRWEFHLPGDTKAHSILILRALEVLYKMKSGLSTDKLLDKNKKVISDIDNILKGIHNLSGIAKEILSGNADAIQSAVSGVFVDNDKEIYRSCYQYTGIGAFVWDSLTKDSSYCTGWDSKDQGDSVYKTQGGELEQVTGAVQVFKQNAGLTHDDSTGMMKTLLGKIEKNVGNEEKKELIRELLGELEYKKTDVRDDLTVIAVASLISNSASYVLRDFFVYTKNRLQIKLGALTEQVSTETTNHVNSISYIEKKMFLKGNVEMVRLIRTMEILEKKYNQRSFGYGYSDYLFPYIGEASALVLYPMRTRGQHDPRYYDGAIKVIRTGLLNHDPKDESLKDKIRRVLRAIEDGLSSKIVSSLQLFGVTPLGFTPK